MEGSLEFLDAEGEWHFDPVTRALYVIPPTGIDLAQSELMLTQTDTLFEFIGSTSESRVENIVFANLSFGHTSAQYFRSARPECTVKLPCVCSP